MRKSYAARGRSSGWGVSLAAALFCASSLLPGRTITVDDSGGAEFTSIQPAINAAVAGDVVSVAAGTYRERLTLKNAVSVIGAGRNVTTVDAERAGAAATLVDCDASTRLEGFRITGGQAPNGGGLLVLRGAPIITNCLITGNTAVASGFYDGYGGGLSLTDSGATVSDNLITSNDAYLGGGVSIYDGSPLVVRNQMTSNSAIFGGALDLNAVSGFNATINANMVSSNRAESGGGFSLVNDGSPLVTNNLITGNTASSSSPQYPAFGGGIYSYNSSSQILNNTLASNVSELGGGVSLQAFLKGVPRLANNIIYNNRASEDGGGAYVAAASATVQNNILFMNTALNQPNNCGGDLSSKCTQDLTNLFVDPGLLNPSGGDYRLRSPSPSIDTGTDVGAPRDDLRGQLRPLDGNRDGTPRHDRGAYEFDRNDVLRLRFSSPSTMTWDAITGATLYNMYSGIAATVGSVGVDTCRDADDANLGDLFFTETRTPAAGSAFAYVVTAEVGGVEGGGGYRSNGLERPLPLLCP